MKIAIAQNNYHVGNIEANTNKINEQIIKAKAQKADMIIFSELAICGYPPLDLLEQKSFIEKSQKAINNILMHVEDIVVIVGAPSINDDPQGKKLYNSAYVLEHGQIKKIVHKTLLPTYDIFDEYRYFEPNEVPEVVEINGHTIAITICEDLWDEQPVDQPFAQSRLYKKAPMKKLAGNSPDLVVNIAASPFSYNQEQKRKGILKRNAHDYQIPLIYVNQVGANTDIIFDGASKVLNTNGEIIKQLKRFEEDFDIVTLEKIEKQGANIQNPSETRIQQIHNAVVLGIRDYFKKSGFEKALLGLSGGIDSAVVAALACEALGSKNVHGLLMPSEFSSDHSVSDAETLALNLGMPHHTLAIKEIYNIVNSTLSPAFPNNNFDVTEENIQARIRGLLLMAYSNKHGNMLLNTSNKSEAAVGYSTLYGDTNGGLSPIGDVYKSDVYAIARYINRDETVIPAGSIEKPPSAELRPDQQDSDSLPDYDILDRMLFEFIERKQSVDDLIGMGFNKQDVLKVTHLVNINEYKRYQFPPILRVSSKAFGMGRRYPIVAKY
ncbi:Glutamine-dependent NAD(+) synthetase [Salinivirga cyanobacteriivorans]|uniref:Glutamine-dependent NAD(+) synthetase n=1 Tax=Salinivirga cyanobacteriivorans TaxID=1307839 RepID=A0A0S2I128_9BACT|nr:NAD+ synthase [Salinivirga cyanobacteriivorans]ALO15950.1 Glutamine-dependent NAD(+) synthetase [Salinivirga cyanobacteriivorans]